jgi:arylsulfatase A-like enzyme
VHADRFPAVAARGLYRGQEPGKKEQWRVIPEKNNPFLPEGYPTLGTVLTEAGIANGTVGKWHVGARVPSHGFQEGIWGGYLGMKEETGDQPFALFLSWGPPHNPFGTAPAEFEAMYDPDEIILPPNVPEASTGFALPFTGGPESARQDLAGYYAHCSALDAAFGRLMKALEETGHDKDTVVVFTSDHGDMLGSQGHFRKQRPWAESIQVPFLVRHLRVSEPRTHRTPVDAPDLMPTLLSLAGLKVPDAVQGKDFSATILEGKPSGIEAALLAHYIPGGEWNFKMGGLEYRGLRTEQYTYIRTLDGPWLLYDNDADRMQQTNRVEDPAHAETVKRLDADLTARLELVGDEFPSGREIIAREQLHLHPNNELAFQHPQCELPEPY